jgi:hypothetical protein
MNKMLNTHPLFLTFHQDTKKKMWRYLVRVILLRNLTRVALVGRQVLICYDMRSVEPYHYAADALFRFQRHLRTSGVCYLRRCA